MRINVKKFSINANNEIVNSNDEVVTLLPPVDEKFILLVDSIDISERISGSENNEQWYQVRILSSRDMILADVPICYNFDNIGYWQWGNAKTNILSQLNLEELS
jgi:hypothetical protein